MLREEVGSVASSLHPTVSTRRTKPRQAPDLTAGRRACFMVGLGISFDERERTTMPMSRLRRKPTATPHQPHPSPSWPGSSPDLCVKAEEAPRLRLGCLGDLLFLEE